MSGQPNLTDAIGTTNAIPQPSSATQEEATPSIVQAPPAPNSYNELTQRVAEDTRRRAEQHRRQDNQNATQNVKAEPTKNKIFNILENPVAQAAVKMFPGAGLTLAALGLTSSGPQTFNRYNPIWRHRLKLKIIGGLVALGLVTSALEYVTTLRNGDLVPAGGQFSTETAEEFRARTGMAPLGQGTNAFDTIGERGYERAMREAERAEAARNAQQQGSGSSSGSGGGGGGFIEDATAITATDIDTPSTQSPRTLSAEETEQAHQDLINFTQQLQLGPRNIQEHREAMAALSHHVETAQDHADKIEKGEKVPEAEIPNAQRYRPAGR